MKNKTLKSIILITLFFYPLKPIFAGQLLSGISCIESGNCSLNDILEVAVKATTILLGLSGSIALLFFVYGGIIFLISGGSPDKVTKGKQIIINSVIGIVIIFTSYIIIDFTMKAMGYSGAWNVSN